MRYNVTGIESRFCSAVLFGNSVCNAALTLRDANGVRIHKLTYF